MKVTLKAALLLSAAGAVNAAEVQCPPIDYNNPSDEYGNPGYVDLDFYFNGTGKLYIHSGCTYWRQNYPRNITRDFIGCLNGDGKAVPVDSGDCADFHYVGATGELEDYQVEVFRNVQNNYECGWDFSTQTGKWLCLDENTAPTTWEYGLTVAPAPTTVNPYYFFPGGYVPGEISTYLWTWYIQYPPNSTANPLSLEYHVPDNPYANQTFLPGDGTYPVVVEMIVESL
ncbi:hypothetical protein F4777DRAFT_70693 [Nemania sp. FL0916]|nr:hypothetical protein F4777DRAFT_70693 [Nemania sp. FL0916]